MSTAPSLALRSLLTGVLRETGLLSPLQRISGATSPVRALAVAAAAKRLAGRHRPARRSNRRRNRIAPSATSGSSSSVLEGSAATVVERQVLPFPSTQVDPYRGFQPHLKVASARARVLHALANGIGARRGRVGGRAAHEASRAGVDPAVVVRDQARHRHRSARAREHPRRSAATSRRIRSMRTASSAAAAASSTCSPPAKSCRSGSSSSATRSNRSAASIPARSDPSRPSIASASSRVREVVSRDWHRYRRICSVPAYARRAGVAVRANRCGKPHQDGLGADRDVLRRRSRTSQRRRAAPPPTDCLVTEDELSRSSASAVVRRRTVVDRIRDRERGTGPRSQLSVQPTATFHGRIPDWVTDVKAAQANGDHVVFVAGSHGRAERTVELLKDYDVRAVMASDAGDVVRGAVMVAEGWLSKGFRLRALKAQDPGPQDPRALQVYAETDVFDEERRKTGAGKKRSASAAFLSDLRDLKVNDLIVHVDHGIGQFVGLKQISVAGGDIVQEFLELRYHGDAKLFVPVERLDLIQKYTGGSKPPLDRLGGTTWEKAKTKVKKAMRDMAEELLKLYAARKAVPGHAFSADTHWQEEFEDAFEFDLTPDQATAIADIKRDMESPTPMDRLLCGDVGYGKTEVAMRAAFKAVMDGKQVAFLAPTTVLAAQHLKTLTRALRGVPREDRHGQPLPHQAGDQGDARRARRRPPRRHRRHASPAVEGRQLQGPRPARRRRRAALRRGAQGAHQADAQEGRRPDHDGDADSAHAEHVAGRHPRHVGDRDAAEGSAGDPDQRRQVRLDGDRPRDSRRDRARRPGVLRPQPRRVDLLDGQPAAAPRARRAHRHRPRPDGRGRARARDARLHDATRPTSCWRRRSSRTASTFPTPTRSSSIAPIATAWRSSISCAAASAAAIARPTPTC